MRLRTDEDTLACPTFGVKLDLDVYAAHSYRREADNLTMKEGRSGCVMDASAARQARIDVFQGSRVSSSAPTRYYFLDVALLTNYLCEAT
jgi:hypothetical protein